MPQGVLVNEHSLAIVIEDRNSTARSIVNEKCVNHDATNNPINDIDIGKKKEHYFRIKGVETQVIYFVCFPFERSFVVGLLQKNTIVGYVQRKSPS